MYRPSTGEVLFDKICRHNGITHRLAAPASSNQNGRVEQFHGNPSSVRPAGIQPPPIRSGATAAQSVTARFEGARVKRLAYAAVVGMLSILALATPGNAAPAPLSDAQMNRMIADTAAALPAPNSAEWAARKAGPQTFTLRPSAGATRTAAAVVTCLAFSQVLRNDGGGFFIAVGEASSSCPAPVDYLSAKATLYFWVPDLNRWEIASYGSLAVATPYRTPGEAVTSVASSNCRAAYFTVLGIHEARLGSSIANARTESNYVQFTCG